MFLKNLDRTMLTFNMHNSSMMWCRFMYELPHLTDEQTRNWTREQKDRWWLENVFRGNMPQLTIRAALTGFLLGGVLSATNLYIGANVDTRVSKIKHVGPGDDRD